MCLVVVVAGQRIHCRVCAEGRPLFAEFRLVLAEVVFQLIQLAALCQTSDDMQMLAEIVPQMPGLFHVGPKLHIASGFHGQQLIFPVELRVPGVFPCDLVHLVQKQEDTQQ